MPTFTSTMDHVFMGTEAKKGSVDYKIKLNEVNGEKDLTLVNTRTE
jgi:hypothetical protein